MKAAPFKQIISRNVEAADVNDAQLTGRSSSLVCGALVKFTIRVNADQEITLAQFKAAACSDVVTACSLIAEAIKGHTTADAANVARSSVLVDFPVERTHCSNLASDAVINAIQNYSDSMRASWEGSETLICACFGVSEQTIEVAISDGGLTTIEEVSLACNAGRGCGSCYGLIQDILDEER